ncbi:ABC transporter ATP-binding protein [Rubellimicrobium arenae]|uniref:ABC transporter ATP-binding protein n=1 Tax=Rubellimicrobium arenae TaxID=2817372 RepID=UPI001B30347B|nr:sn-glycerol-3-phosphate ABC transporter ATP-binding protein UgpC [Rubellimicrobium arenae]
MADLRLDRISKRFGALEVIPPLDLTLEDGGFLVLLGPSGCGKSTLLSIVAGLEAPSEGEVLIGGRRVTSAHPKDRNIAMVFQSYALYPTMDVRRNLGFGLEMRGIDGAQRHDKVTRAAELLQITHLLDRRPAQLSGGQRQRVAMGRAIVRDPDLFLFDEPLSNLDAKLRVEMRTEIRRLHDRLGTTTVYVTHDQVEAMTLATRVAVMKGGVIQQLADPQTVYERPANIFVASFVGSPAMNFLNGRVVVQGDMPMFLPDGADPVRLAGLPLHADGRRLVLGVRPEHLSLGAGEARLGGVVDVMEPTGPDNMATVRIGSASVIARLPPRSGLKAGTPVSLALQADACSLFDPDSGARLSLGEYV